ncbi:MAG: hypothetical protein GVY27_08145, partial [Deinococcus-Thermus bacterium]|nr:hypothetical protein [Deinococcota bacterium]
MKKLFITLAAAMILAGGAFAQSFPDIPEGHWAGDAVERIADLNIVIGFPDGTFRGNEAFTRYQAALVISRMLDVINANMDSAMAMTEEDIASLRNAVQELAADVAAQGVRLSAAEGAIAGLSDDTTANADRIAELEAMLDGMEMQPEIDPAVLRDLQNQVASLRVATDTAQATADTAQAAADAAQATADEAMAAAGDAQDAAEGAEGAAMDAMSAAEAAQQAAGGAQETAEVAQATADQANSRANAAASTAEANASEIAALNDLIQILGDQIEELQAMSGQMDAAS